MRYSAILLAAVPALSLAENILLSRAAQGDAFRPGTNTISGTCASNGLSNCGTRLCIDPRQGDVCCSAAQSWGCPGRSFCLIDGLCCPDGEDPKTCAQRNGVQLPSNFGKNPPAPAPAPVPAPAPAPIPAPAPAPSYSTPPTSSAPIYTPPAQTSATPQPSANGTIVAPSVIPSIIPGGASQNKAAGVMGALGVVGMIIAMF